MPMARTLFSGEDVVIGVSRCGSTGPALSVEELDSEFTVVLPQSGIYVRHVEGEEVVANPAVALFVNPGEVSRTRHPTGGNDHSVYMTLSPQVADWFSHGRPVPRRRPLTARLSLDVKRTTTRAQRGEVLVSLHVDELVAALASLTVSDNRPDRVGTAAVGRAEEYLSVHFAEDADLKTVTAEVGYSPHHLSRLFRMTTGMTITQYRTRLRVDAAMARLLGGDDDIATVAAETGFYDHSHLVRHMRRQTGITPGQIRHGWRAGR